MNVNWRMGLIYSGFFGFLKVTTTRAQQHVHRYGGGYDTGPTWKNEKQFLKKEVRNIKYREILLEVRLSRSVACSSVFLVRFFITIIIIFIVLQLWGRSFISVAFFPFVLWCGMRAHLVGGSSWWWPRW